MNLTVPPASDRPRVAIIVASLGNKGPVVVARDLASELVSKGHEVHVYHLDDVRQLTFECPVSRLDWASIRQLRRFDVVHTHSLRPDALGWILRNIFRTKAVFVSTIHSYIDQDLAFTYGKFVAFVFSGIARLVWRGLDGSAVLSKDALRHYAGLQTSTVLKVIHNGRSVQAAAEIDEDVSSAKLFFRGRKVIGACAVLGRRKGLHQVIEAIAEMDDWGFLLIGDGPEMAQLQRLAEQRGVGERVLFMGWKDNPVPYLDVMEIYAMTSYSEGLPLALLDAASKGKAIVCSDTPLFREVFSDDEVCYFRLDDIASLRRAMLGAYEDMSRRGALTRARFEREYSVSLMADRYILFYKDLMKGGAGEMHA